MDDFIEAVPAYGRDYKNKAEVTEAWVTGKDFRMTTGPYINIQDWIKYGGRSIVIRYGNGNKFLDATKLKPKE